jgi:hypothetical protein
MQFNVSGSCGGRGGTQSVLLEYCEQTAVAQTE